MKKTKKLKGMTLVECITALAVMAVMTTAMATAASGLAKVKVSTNNVIRKNSYQANVADNKKDDKCYTSASGTITIMQGSDELAVMNADKYTVMERKTDSNGQYVTKEDGSYEYIAATDASNSRNFKYYDKFRDLDAKK